ncbi:MAG: 50S ribosomal protein L29 [Candidatus Aminicenantia bacterium]
MKASELRELSNEELSQKLSDLKAQLFTLKMKKFISLENPLKIRHLRKDIARILTILKEREGKESS